jgi:hypothetical protein
MKTKDQSAQDSDVKLIGKYMEKKFMPIIAVFVVVNVVLIFVFDALGTNREISALSLAICCGLVGAFSRRYMKRKFMSIWTGQGAGTDRTPWTKEETSRH